MVTWIHTFDDVAAKGMVILLECRCGRKRWMAPGDLVGTKVNGHPVLGRHEYVDVARQLRCSGCDRRGPDIRPMFPDEAGVPKGVPALAYLRADERERKRLVRQARG